MSAAHRVWLGDVDDAGTLARLHAGAVEDAWPEAAFDSLLSRAEVFVLLGARPTIAAAEGFVLVRTVAGEAEILTFCVSERARRCGLGMELLVGACEIARGRESTHMFLEVSEKNAAAKGLYQKIGFAAVGRRAAYYRQGSVAADAIVMRKELSAPIPQPDEGLPSSFRDATESTKRE